MTMNDEARNKILDRVKKMLKLAANAGATEGERDNAMRMARATLAKHNLDMAEVEARGDKVPGEERVMHEGVFYGRPWARGICVAIGDLCFCDYLYVSNKKGSQTKHLFVGKLSNAVTAMELTQFLVEAIHREAKRFQRDNYLGNDSYRSFAWGAVSSIRRRVAEMLATPTAESVGASETASSTEVAKASQALVLIGTNEKAANKALITKMLGKPPEELGSGRRGQGVGDRDAMGAGRAYGDTVSLNRQVGGSRQKQLTR